MLYTISFTFIGALIAYMFGKLTGVDFSRSRYAPSFGHILTFFGGLIGGSIGFGYGTSLLLAGTHYYNTLFHTSL